MEFRCTLPPTIDDKVITRPPRNFSHPLRLPEPFMFIPEPIHDSTLEVDEDGNGPGATATRIVTRRKDFWFHDGSVVLRTSNTLFKVHQTVLAAHSEVFADLFTLPQPESPSCEEMVDRCHVVQLYDSVQDLADVLRAIYIPSYVPSVPLFPSEINPRLGTSTPS